MQNSSWDLLHSSLNTLKFSTNLNISQFQIHTFHISSVQYTMRTGTAEVKTLVCWWEFWSRLPNIDNTIQLADTHSSKVPFKQQSEIQPKAIPRGRGLYCAPDLWMGKSWCLCLQESKHLYLWLTDEEERKSYMEYADDTILDMHHYFQHP
jgi:hypothetical protein